MLERAADPERETIGSRWADIATRMPQRVAIAERGVERTFGELDALSNAIGRRILSSAGNRAGFVGLLFENKLPAVAAVLGATRSGHAYVPLDARDPDERLRFILRDSEPVALVTEASLAERARALAPGCPILEADRVEVERTSALLAGNVAADAPAYAFYTSGSTGQPKGVLQTHRNVLFFADAFAKTLRLAPGDRLTLLFSLSFGGSSMGVFGGLLRGATLCAYDLRRDGIASLADWIDRERISVFHAVGTVYRELMASLAPGRKLAVRAIDIGGEAMFDRDMALFREHTVDDCVFVNHLAATEAHVIAQHVVDHATAIAPGVLPAGRSPEGLRLLIRREDGSEADRNEVGNLVLASRYLSPGYWRRPELDQRAFATDPHDPAGRLYFTGDLARIDEAGLLHFIGRKGSRVKIRGHTVELTEVEAALAACPGIAAAVVRAAAGDRLETQRLVAYVVASPETRDPVLIGRHLAQRLPAYMLPARYVFLDELPLTATRKLDREALARIDEHAAGAAGAAREVDPPRDDLERSIAAIFERMLKLAPVGRDDDFFLLGGDSLSVAELHTRLHDTFGTGLVNPIREVTVAGIAARIRRGRATARAVEALPVLFPLKETGAAPPMFIVHGRLGQPFVSPYFLSLLGDDLPIWAFQARGLDGLDAPHATIEAMAADYLSEMRKRRPHGPYFLAALCAGALIANVMARMLRDAGEVVLPLLLFDPPESRMRASVADADLLSRIRTRKSQFVTPIDDETHASAAVRVARAFEIAIWEHQPTPYDGPVFMLSSRDRMTNPNPRYLGRLFSGNIERVEVGATHGDSLDPHNPVFVEHLTRCVTRILEDARSAERGVGEAAPLSILDQSSRPESRSL